MQRFCQVIALKPEARDEYIRIHAAVWPSVLGTIAACNIHNYSIYLHGDLIIAYFEYTGIDYAADMQKMAADPETQRWWLITDPMQTILPGTPEGKKWLELSEEFHTD